MPAKKVVKVELPALIEHWARMQLPIKQLCIILDISPDTWERNAEWRLLYEKGKEDGRANLRAKQMEMALKGDRTMLIWLGKQYLGQKDTQNVEVTGVGPVNLGVVNNLIADPELSRRAAEFALAVATKSTPQLPAPIDVEVIDVSPQTSEDLQSKSSEPTASPANATT